MANDEEEDIAQLERVTADLLNLGNVPQASFRRLMDDSINHVVATVAADPQANNRRWRNLGPRNIGGRIRALAIHPRDGSTVYAGSALGGVWKTTDAGDSWQPLDNFQPPNRPGQALPIGAIAVAPSNPSVVYVGTGEPTSGYISGSGLYWSQNAGVVFNQIDHVDTGAIRAERFERIRVDPWEHRRLWCASPDRGLWRGQPATPPTFVQDVIDAPGAPAAGAQHATDVLVRTGDPRGVSPTQFTVFVALRGAGVYRATFNRTTDAYVLTGGVAWSKLTIPGLDALAGFHRIKLAHCETLQSHMYCVAGISNTGNADHNRISSVFVSSDGGTNWTATSSPRKQPGDTSTITWYSLVLECSPLDKNTLFVGQVDMWCSHDGGATWGTPDPAAGRNFLPCLDRVRYREGDRAQHADQQAAVFDRDRPRVAWVANDGGVSRTANMGLTWRKRSHGILATQFVDVSSNPRHPFQIGGGLQDNGTWMTYGGMSWLKIGHSDGGDMGFDPTTPSRYHYSSQQGVWVGRMGTPAIGTTREINPAPDLAPALLSNAYVETHSSFLLDAAQGFLASDLPGENGDSRVFYGVVTHHPVLANHVLMGRYVNAYVTTDGVTFAPAGHTPATRGGANTEISAVTYGPTPNNDWWVGTSHGEVFATANGGGIWRNATEPLGSRGSWISGIATHPSNSAIAAIAVATRPGTVYITGDGGIRWLEISGRAGAGGANWAASPSAGPGDQFSPGPATAITFDRNSPNSPAAAQTLYVGSAAGVYVIRNALPSVGATPPVPGFQPVWRTLNTNLPLIVIYEIEAIAFADAAGTNHQRLRVATFGRGIYEADLAAAPVPRLLIRRHIDDNGLALPNQMTTEPRTAVGLPGPALVNDAALDIRVDSLPFQNFGGVVDSVEFDQQLVSGDVAAGEPNLVYAQVHNVGAATATGAQVSLYFAPAAGAPAAAPNLPANFWAAFPAVAPAPWQLIGTRGAGITLVSGEPKVLCFRWDAPAALTGNIALLALASDPADRLDAPPPATDVATLVTAERRAAVRIAAVTANPGNAQVRDGVDDRGALGTTAWGARSNDIVVVHAIEPTPDVTFADQSDTRAGDVLDGSETNRIYLRVHNRGADVLNNVSVRLFSVPFATLSDTATWQPRGTVAIASIPGRSQLFAPVIEWPNPPDPGVAKGHLLVALIQADGEPALDFAGRVGTVAEFWHLLVEAQDSGNAALRGIRWQT